MARRGQLADSRIPLAVGSEKRHRRHLGRSPRSRTDLLCLLPADNTVPNEPPIRGSPVFTEQ